eukprot:6212319-Pleurochrysis_carterae.AAC.1
MAFSMSAHDGVVLFRGHLVPRVLLGRELAQRGLLRLVLRPADEDVAITMSTVPGSCRRVPARRWYVSSISQRGSTHQLTSKCAVP